MIEVSIVVPTRNRAARLAPFFEAIDRLGIDGVRSELVMVDNGSTDGTFETFQEWVAGRPGLRMVREDLPGSGVARNRGWRAATGAIVAMLDDDCYAQPGFIEAFVQVFQETRRSVGAEAGFSCTTRWTNPSRSTSATMSGTIPPDATCHVARSTGRISPSAARSWSRSADSIHALVREPHSAARTSTPWPGRPGQVGMGSSIRVR